jgi:hypothetical protein
LLSDYVDPNPQGHPVYTQVHGTRQGKQDRQIIITLGKPGYLAGL